MLLAAYMVAGFIVAGVYAAGLLRGRRDPLPPARPRRPASPWPRSRRRCRSSSGDVAAREVFQHEPAKFAAIEMLPRTATHVPETLGGVMIDGEPGTASTSPRAPRSSPGSVPPRSSAGSTRSRRSTGRPTGWSRSCTWRSTSWSASGSHCSPSPCGSRSPGGGGGPFRRTAGCSAPWRSAARSRSSRCGAAGWSRRSGGSRGPSSVCCSPGTPSRRTGNLWLFFGGTLLLYVAVGVGTFAVLRLLRRRWAEGDTVEGGDADVPYGPSKARDLGVASTGGQGR